MTSPGAPSVGRRIGGVTALALGAAFAAMFVVVLVEKVTAFTWVAAFALLLFGTAAALLLLIGRALLRSG